MIDWKILNDPDTHDCETKKHDYYYTRDLLAYVRVKRISDDFLLCRVRAGKKVNGASIPLLCQILIPKSGKQNRPSAFHDSGFEDGGLDFWIDGEWKFIALEQQEMDYIYLKLMESREVASWNRRTQYAGLRIGGWWQWRKYRKLDNKN